MISRTTERSTQATEDDINSLIAALDSSGRPDAAWKVRRHTSGYFQLWECSRCGERKATPLSCDYPLCPRCRKRLLQRHASELRKFGQDIPTVWVISVIRSLYFQGWKKTLRRCHRMVGGCFRFDVRPTDDGWEHLVVITGVPEDDIGFVLEQARAFGELYRVDDYPLSDLDQVLDSNGPSLSDFRNYQGKLLIYVSTNFGARIIHSRRPRHSDSSDSLEALDLEALAEELCQVETDWRQGQQAQQPSWNSSGNPPPDPDSDMEVPATPLDSNHFNGGHTMPVEVTMHDSTSNNTNHDHTEPETGQVAGQCQPDTPGLPRRRGHQGCQGRFVPKGIYQLRDGILRRVSGNGPEAIDPATVLDPTGELTALILAGEHG